MDADMNDVNDEKLQVEETDNPCIVDFNETVPLTRDTDRSRTTECVSGDPFGEVRETDLADLKQEPDDVCCVLYPLLILSPQRNLYRCSIAGRFWKPFNWYSGQYTKWCK